MAISTATVAFTAAGADSQSFTWSPPLVSNPPKVLSVSVVSTTTPQVGANAWIAGTPTNTGGTVALSAAIDATVTITGSD